jgi:hypothetical protein
VQRLLPAARVFGVGRAGGCYAALVIANANRVVLGVVPLVAADSVLGKFEV